MPIGALSVLCAQLTRDLLAIAKFLYFHVYVQFNFNSQLKQTAKAVMTLEQS